MQHIDVSSSRGHSRAGWAAFVAPVGVSCLVMAVASLGLLGHEVERLSASPSGLFDDTSESAQTEDESVAPIQQEEVEPSAQQVGGPRRKRGFSPVLGAQAEVPSAAPPEPEYDEDGEEVVARVPRSKRRYLAPERREGLLNEVSAASDKVPFMRGFKGALQRVRERRAAASAPGNDGTEPPLAVDEVSSGAAGAPGAPGPR